MKKYLLIIFCSLLSLNVFAQTQTEVQGKKAVNSLKSNFSIVEPYLDRNGLLDITEVIDGNTEIIAYIERVSKTQYIISELKFTRNNIYLSLDIKIEKDNIVVIQYYSKTSIVDGVKKLTKDGPILMSNNIATLEELTSIEMLLRAAVITFNKTKVTPKIPNSNSVILKQNKG